MYTSKRCLAYMFLLIKCFYIAELYSEGLRIPAPKYVCTRIAFVIVYYKTARDTEPFFNRLFITKMLYERTFLFFILFQLRLLRIIHK